MGLFDAGQTLIKSLVFDTESFVIKSQQVKHGCMKVIYMNRVLYNVISKLICFSIHNSRFNPATGHPDRVGAWVMIAAVVFF